MNILNERIMRNLLSLSASTILLCSCCAFNPSSCKTSATETPPEFSNFDKFESVVAEKLSGTSDSKNFVISPTPGGAYPIGTLLPYGRTVEIFDECSINQPPLYNADNLNVTYTLTRGVALDAGLSQAIGPLASAGISIADNSSVSLGLADAKIQQLSYAQLSNLLSQPACRTKISGQNLLIVRGYVQAKRVFSTKAQKSIEAKADITKIANFDAKFDDGTQTLTVNDSAPASFLQITSVVFIPAPTVGTTPSQISLSTVLVNPTATSIDPQQKGLVYIQIDRNDSPSNGDKVKQLLSGKFTVAKDIERIQSAKMPTTPQVRYFNAADKADADAAVELLRTVYPNAFAKYIGLPAPAGQLEVWLARQG
ncbi:hypothetical protein G3N59_34390 [Paraburkholderia sp. Ac-20340]|uniref:hypothetical protein n=1 Tax=Paraburkholderia sp. Ac-20340 TaxID=2703888 RepID=UPI00197D610A|nr:hypothetical protein [Paraburkholderia sp. Ac-20340]MBN3858490.1 hypothetical protein [Paraburkholderia sp. Ac-20340]